MCKLQRIEEDNRRRLEELKVQHKDQIDLVQTFHKQ
jgi:hypothetical protein